jgi:hypothetical protein
MGGKNSTLSDIIKMKERKRKRRRRRIIIIIIIIRNGAKTISLQTLFGRLNKSFTHYPDSEPTSLFFLSNAACLAEKQQIPIL